MKRSRIAIIGDTYEFARLSAEGNVLAQIPRLKPERTPGPTLAGQTVADRDADRLTLYDCL